MYYATPSGKIIGPKGIVKPEVYEKAGALRVGLYRNGEHKHFLVHRLIWATFGGPLIKGLVICHNDGNWLNNPFCNLRQDTLKKNLLDW